MKWIITATGKDFHTVETLVNDDNVALGQVVSRYGDVYGVCDLRQPKYGSPNPYAIAYCLGLDRAKAYLEELMKGDATDR